MESMPPLTKKESAEAVSFDDADREMKGVDSKPKPEKRSISVIVSPQTELADHDVDIL
jgi:hypothetical protein